MKRYALLASMCSILSVSLSLCFCESILAKTADEYLNQAYQLISQARFDEALDVLIEGHDQNPGDIEFVFAIAETYHNKGDYQSAIGNYLNILIAVETAGDRAPAVLHENLIRAYNSLGQKHYFSEELCLRIIYHTEEFLEQSPEFSENADYIEFLRKSVGHYDVAKMGAKMMETGGDGEEFELYPDKIDQERKFFYKAKAERRITNADKKQEKSKYKVGPSDRSIDEITFRIRQKIQKLKSIRFKKIGWKNNEFLEEIFFKHPDKFKAIDQNAVSVWNNGSYHVVDRTSKRIVGQDVLSLNEIDPFRSLFLPNFDFFAKYYVFEIKQLLETPVFLKGFYSQTKIFPNLYLLTANLNKNDKSPFYPEVVKIEFLIDFDLGLAVGIRKYWRGILGSGRTENLAEESFLKSIQFYSKIDGYLPNEGVTVGHVAELRTHTGDWYVDILMLNTELSDQEFNVEQYRKQ